MHMCADNGWRAARVSPSPSARLRVTHESVGRVAPAYVARPPRHSLYESFWAPGRPGTVAHRLHVLGEPRALRPVEGSKRPTDAGGWWITRNGPLPIIEVFDRVALASLCHGDRQVSVLKIVPGPASKARRSPRRQGL